MPDMYGENTSEEPLTGFGPAGKNVQSQYEYVRYVTAGYSGKKESARDCSPLNTTCCILLMPLLCVQHDFILQCEAMLATPEAPDRRHKPLVPNDLFIPCSLWL